MTFTLPFSLESVCICPFGLLGHQVPAYYNPSVRCCTPLNVELNTPGNECSLHFERDVVLHCILEPITKQMLLEWNLQDFFDSKICHRGKAQEILLAARLLPCFAISTPELEAVWVIEASFRAWSVSIGLGLKDKCVWMLLSQLDLWNSLFFAA